MLIASNLVHLDPSWINALLRELLDHRLADEDHSNWWTKELIDFCRRNGLVFSELITLHKNFLKTGRLTKVYLRFLWRNVPGVQDTDVLPRMISTMSTYGAMLPCDPGRAGTSEFVVPVRLRATVAEETLAELKAAISTGTRMHFVIPLFARYIPPGVISQFLGSFCRSSRILFRACWSRGASFIMDGREHLVCLRGPAEDVGMRIEIDIAGSTRETVSDHGFTVFEAVCNLLADRYSGLLFDPSGDPQFSVGRDAWQDRLDALRDHLDRHIDQA